MSPSEPEEEEEHEEEAEHKEETTEFVFNGVAYVSLKFYASRAMHWPRSPGVPANNPGI